MANGYNPFQYTQAVSQLGGQTGAAGSRWEGLQKGTSRESIREWLEEQSRKASEASSKLGMVNLGSKLLGTLAMLIPGVREATLFGSTILPQFLTGAAVSGATSKWGGDWATQGLSMEDAPDVLYNVDTAKEAETTAHTAIDKLLSSVNPGAVQSAITTPLSVLSMKNYQVPADVAKKAAAETVGSEVASSVSPVDAYQSMVNRFKGPELNEDNLLDMYRQGLPWMKGV